VTMMTAPTLILIGEADDWTPAKRCLVMVAHARPDGALIALTRYSGAHHGFNFAILQPAEPPSAIGSNITSRRRAMQKRRCGHFWLRIWGLRQRTSRPQSENAEVRQTPPNRGLGRLLTTQVNKWTGITSRGLHRPRNAMPSSRGPP
jgi:hypothetical protein